MQWRTLSDADRDYYDGLAREDRERYNRECAVSLNFVLDHPNVSNSFR